MAAFSLPTYFMPQKIFLNIKRFCQNELIFKFKVPRVWRNSFIILCFCYAKYCLATNFHNNWKILSHMVLYTIIALSEIFTHAKRVWSILFRIIRSLPKSAVFRIIFSVHVRWYDERTIHNMLGWKEIFYARKFNLYSLIFTSANESVAYASPGFKI